MDIAVEKNEIIKWINSLDNPVVIEQIKRIKKRETETFDFEKEWENGITSDELRKSTKEFLKSLPCKK
jgi:hypothetical protein